LGNRFILAHARGLHAYNDAFGPKRSNWAEMVATLIKHTLVKDPARYEQMGWSYINPNCRLNMLTVTEDPEWYLRNGWVTERPDLSRVIDNSYCDYAVQQLGTYQPWAPGRAPVITQPPRRTGRAPGHAPRRDERDRAVPQLR